MKAYLIDPIARKITEVEHNGDYRNIYKLCDYTTFTTVRLNYENDTLFVDDEGLIKGPVYQFIGFKGYGQPLAGRGLILGTNDEGESVSPAKEIAWFKERLFWVERLSQTAWSMTPYGKKRPRIGTIEAICNALVTP